MIRFRKDDDTAYPDLEKASLKDISFYVTKTKLGPKKSFISTENMKKECAGVIFDIDDGNPVKGIGYEPNDILVSNIRPYLKKTWKADRTGICSTDVLCIRGRDFVNSNFLYAILSSDKFFDYDMQGAKGTKMPRGDKKHIMNMPVFLPCLEEQQKIADFLSSVDEVIFESEKELANLEIQKKGAMQKIFSQEVRFNADNGSDYPDWEEKHLGEITELYTGKSFSKQLSEDGQFIVMDMGTVTSDGLRIEKKHTDVDRDVLLANDLVMPKDDIGGGLIICKTVHIPMDNKYVLGDHVYRLRFLTQNGLFMHYLINCEDVHTAFMKKVTGSAQKGIKASDVSNQAVRLPCLEEQQKIADFLSDFDTAIEEAKKEIECWKQIKKGLLQQIFDNH